MQVLLLLSNIGTATKHGTSSPATLHLMLISGITLDALFCRSSIERGT